MDNAAFDTLAAARELEAAGMDRGLAEITALNMHRAGTAHLDRLATKADLKTGLAELKADMLKAALGIVIANAAFVVANAGIVIATLKFM